MRKMVTVFGAVLMSISLAACGGQKTEDPAAAAGSELSSGIPSAVEGNMEGTEGGQADISDLAESVADGGNAEESAGGAEEKPDTIKVTSLNGEDKKIELEVPYDPERVAVLDMAALDMLDNWGLGDRVVGMPKSSKIDYLMDYNNNEEIVNLGTLKEVDMEALMSSEPDIIFIGGRLSGQYDKLSEIAPVIYTATDYETGLVESIKDNSLMIASIFGVEDKARETLAGFDERIAALAKEAEGKTAVIGMVTSSNFNTLGDGSRCSLIGNEIGFNNLANNVDSTHGNESSFELLVSLNPEYIFVLDRDSAINTEGAKLAEQVMDNELVQKTSAYQNDRIVYLTPTVWYLAEGGITAMDVMLRDLENGMGK
ncbi:ABC transporter substrate-binding protein [Clostridium sp. MCC353]|uniref:siderophore ABC transporter substrate-binding protein n=1 Tax=Clostridium sp. MCC353 TaxID=2592646 RepID=UPI001C038A85|nr:ABC transporter substrate-binding protein [Clostridium sp. MCC353]MBT9776079.1 ABC transporter substrate-binding protein [Clostridium sp. MCC353]